MELVAVLFMIVAGISVAAGVMVAVGAAARAHEQRIHNDAPRDTSSDRHHVGASILYQILVVGGTAPDVALREIRRRTGLAVPVTAGVDVANWGEAFARHASIAERQQLLEYAVMLVAAGSRLVPLRQYAALLDLSFGLGFRTDALARLRQQYGFEYIDHAKDARPREADRAGAATTFFARDTRPPAELLRVLGIEENGAPTRQVIITAYRRLVAQHHPDRFHDQPAAAQADAAARFIEITRAYEALLAIYRE